jgi:hypothetical protein
MEDALAGIWAEVLGRDRVGPDEDFFSLGGNSLLAVRMVALVRERLGGDAPVQRMLQARTVTELARAMGAATEAEEEGEI